ncbi:MAG: 50S ribosomal protein L25 [Candidatus Omnitrophota bacterium]|nr:50S ribosomal protein L25 [Candidatus Omnitrophota bacterium]MDZ4242412.1 50S ribosomal protein L25 [Candidatus Omnitrophota bacterium]
MEEIKLDVLVRSEIGSRRIKGIRRENFVPAVLYGEGQKATAIKVDRKIYERIRRQHHGENIIFHINVLEGEKKLKDYPAIVKEEQLNPVTDEVLHIDFNQISLKKKITVKVALVAKGEPVGVKRDGGSLSHMLWELDIVCLPTQIPHHIEVEVSKLEISDSIHVKDIVLPEGVAAKNDPETIVLTVVPPMKEEAPSAEAGAEAKAEPEVIKEKKPEAGEKKAEEGGEAKADPKKEAKKDAK